MLKLEHRNDFEERCTTATGVDTVRFIWIVLVKEQRKTLILQQSRITTILMTSSCFEVVFVCGHTLRETILQFAYSRFEVLFYFEKVFNNIYNLVV